MASTLHTASSQPTDSDAGEGVPPGADSGSPLGGDAATGPDCPPSAKLIYVTGVESESAPIGNDLYSFDPTTGSFKLIGAMSCLEGPTHMTVDRQGTAWVVANGELYKASTENASCARVTSFTPDPDRFPDFALSFVATDTSLYLLGTSGELGEFNTTVGGPVLDVGTISIPASGDMTTGGDGTLYYLEQAATQTLNELNPANASIIHSWTTGKNSMNTQALAYYGGLFYDFIGNAVFTYDTSTSTTKSIGTAPIYVTGAGQSTCVPSESVPPAMLK